MYCVLFWSCIPCATSLNTSQTPHGRYTFTALMFNVFQTTKLQCYNSQDMNLSGHISFECIVLLSITYQISPCHLAPLTNVTYNQCFLSLPLLPSLPLPFPPSSTHFILKSFEVSFDQTWTALRRSFLGL